MLKNFSSRAISGLLEAKVGGKQFEISTFATIKDTVFCQGKKTVIHWGLFPVGGEIRTVGDHSRCLVGV